MVFRQMSTRNEIIEIAKRVVQQEGWPWEGPIQVLRRRRWVLFGPVEWEIMTYTDYRGGNVYIMIDDKTGKVIGKSFYPY
jgi:hypothetical protein